MVNFPTNQPTAPGKPSLGMQYVLPCYGSLANYKILKIWILEESSFAHFTNNKPLWGRMLTCAFQVWAYLGIHKSPSLLMMSAQPRY